ncbi:AAA domain-containing protein [Chitinophaga costaii]|uniref:AAA domain-containing protein n=1 Tax=Chitinophaga costaii TaxID=1335309 RepID=A0A1C4AT68_9BACT|nr:AAA family ATPase [Chitinophaga costaii]PUZ26735.1 anticodon nuclease [Chitinophaga costaii]SCB97825.1 AAA domain-containing protein [Chitinophaga costaii]
MAQSLIEIAQTLKDADKKVQLIYAFNGSGKTRLSREFKELIAPKELDAEQQEESGTKILYYNAFTEDLFYWDNDLDADSDRKLKIQPNSFTYWVLREQGQDRNIVENFQQLTNDKLTPQFSEDFTEVRFSFERGNENDTEFVKISKGEESCFIWSVFFSLIEQVISVLNIAEKEIRETDQYNNLDYIFIDDPVSSLDDTHLIELAVNIAELIKSSTSELKFIITTHNPLFYNVLFNEFNRVKSTKKMRLEKLNDGTFSIGELASDSPFSYHLFLLSELEKAIQPPSDIKKFHFNFLRNILEKTSTFLGYNKWEDLLPQESREAYYKRIINLSSHSKHNGDEISIVEENDKRVLGFLVGEIKRMYGFKSIVKNNETE